MAFFKFRWPGRQQPQADAAKPARRSASASSATRNAPVQSIEDMRRRARHRLIGAVVLVAAGVVGFPLVFDSQPRPVPVDVAIDIPDRHRVAPLVVPPAPAVPEAASGGLSAGEELVGVEPQRPVSAPVPAPASGDAAPAALPPPSVTETARAEPKPEAKPEAKPEPKREARVEAKAEPATKPEPVARSEPRPDAKAAAAEDARRARALLEGRESPAAAAPAPARNSDGSQDAGRFIVQVGAFADADKAREVQIKLERSGLKAYTQVVETKDGKRTRVRVGPFGSRADADRAAERARGAGLAGSVLAL